MVAGAVRVTNAGGHAVERIAVFDNLEEVAAGDVGVILFVIDLAGGKVERGEMRGEEGDVAPVDAGKKFLVREVGIGIAPG